MKRSFSRLAGLLLLSAVALLPLLALLPFRATAQYPFERYPSVRYAASGEWQLSQATSPPHPVSATATVRAGSQSYNLRVFNRRIPADTFYVALSTGGATRQFLEPWYLLPESLTQPVRVADLNGDGLTDLKLVINAGGGGAVRGLVRLVYLFSRPGGGFAKVSFLSFHDGPERDFDGDGNYEMVVRELVSYRGHSYWSFNVFSYTGGQLVNVSSRYGYPVLIRFLNKPNYQVSTHISRQEAVSSSSTGRGNTTTSKGDRNERRRETGGGAPTLAGIRKKPVTKRENGKKEGRKNSLILRTPLFPFPPSVYSIRTARPFPTARARLLPSPFLRSAVSFIHTLPWRGP